MAGTESENLLNSLLGVVLIGSVYARHDLSLEEEMGYSLQDILAALAELIANKLIDSDPKWTDVGNALSIILQNNNFKEDRDYTYINDRTDVAINMQRAHRQYTKAAKLMARNMEVLDNKGSAGMCVRKIVSLKHGLFGLEIKRIRQNYWFSTQKN